MILSIFKASALSLARDRPAFALTFILPPIIYLVFASVFSGATDANLNIRLAVAFDETRSIEALIDRLESAPELSKLLRVESRDAIDAALRNGRADVGLEIRRQEKNPAPSFILIEDATKRAASLTAEQALERLKPQAEEDLKGASFSRARVNPVNAERPSTAYYIGGVAMLFLFLSSFQTALSLLDERDNGLLERISIARSGLSPVILGKFAFIWVQGIMQIGLILCAAQLFFDVDLSHAPMILAATAIAASFAASGLAIGVTLCCASQAEAHAVGVVSSLLIAAIGGSMAPAFLMPEALQAAGSLTPNALGIKAFGAALWTGGGWQIASGPLLALASAGLGGLVMAHLLMRFFMARPN